MKMTLDYDQFSSGGSGKLKNICIIPRLSTLHHTKNYALTVGISTGQDRNQIAVVSLHNCQARGPDHVQVNSRGLQGLKKLLVILRSQGLLEIDSIISKYHPPTHQETFLDPRTLLSLHEVDDKLSEYFRETYQNDTGHKQARMPQKSSTP